MAYSPAGNNTTSAGLAHLATVWYNRRALDQLKKRFRFYNCCEPDMIPRRSGKTVQWFRYTLLGANTTAAPEGAVGNSNTLTTTTLSGTVSEYARQIGVLKSSLNTWKTLIMGNQREAVLCHSA